MMEAEQPGTGGARASTAGDEFRSRVQEGFECLFDAFRPPDAACKHFREARIEVLRGIREIIDHRIQRLSRQNQSGGTKIVVE